MNKEVAFTKVTEGCVLQSFDKDGKFLGARFIAGDDCTYEDADTTDEDNLIHEPTELMDQAYQPFDMVQPKD